MDVGYILASLGAHYPWASPEYVLNKMNVDQIILYQDYIYGLKPQQTDPDYLTVEPVNGKRVLRR